jgi:hypothetical protein
MVEVLSVKTIQLQVFVNLIKRVIGSRKRIGALKIYIATNVPISKTWGNAIKSQNAPGAALVLQTQAAAARIQLRRLVAKFKDVLGMVLIVRLLEQAVLAMVIPVRRLAQAQVTKTASGIALKTSATMIQPGAEDVHLALIIILSPEDFA